MAPLVNVTVYCETWDFRNNNGEDDDDDGGDDG